MTRVRASLALARTRVLVVGCVVVFSGCDARVVLGERLATNPTPPVIDDGGGGEGAGGSIDPGPVEPVGEILWSSTSEVGDFSEWEGDGAATGGLYSWASGDSVVTTERAHSGTHSIRCSIDTDEVSPGDTSHGARLYRRASDDVAFYGAWFWLDAAHVASEWWSIFLFTTHDVPGELDGSKNLWELRLIDDSGSLGLAFYDHGTATLTPIALGHAVPVRAWFHVELRLDPSPSSRSASLWFDGDPVLSNVALSPPSSDFSYWVLGNGSNALAPSASRLYLDDVTMATFRVGP